MSRILKLLYRPLFVGAAVFAVKASPQMTDLDIGLNIPAQATAHATVLGLLATVTAVFLYMTLQWVMVRHRDEQTKDPETAYQEAVGLSVLLFALISFGIAAFGCATLAGLAGTYDTNALRPYVAMMNVYALYLWGIFLAAMGGMYLARLFKFGLTNTVPNSVVLQLIAVAGLIALHPNVSFVLQAITNSNTDWFLYLAVGLVILDSIWSPLKIGGRPRHRLAWPICTLAAVTPLAIGSANFLFIRLSWLRSATNTQSIRIWLVTFYILSGLTMSVLVHTYCATAKKAEPQS